MKLGATSSTYHLSDNVYPGNQRFREIQKHLSNLPSITLTVREATTKNQLQLVILVTFQVEGKAVECLVGHFESRDFIFK